MLQTVWKQQEEVASGKTPLFLPPGHPIRVIRLPSRVLDPAIEFLLWIDFICVSPTVPLVVPPLLPRLRRVPSGTPHPHFSCFNMPVFGVSCTGVLVTAETFPAEYGKWMCLTYCLCAQQGRKRDFFCYEIYFFFTTQVHRCVKTTNVSYMVHHDRSVQVLDSS